MSNNKLQVILNEQGIEKSDVAKLVEAFGGPFEEAGQILATYKDIKVTDEKDTAGMAKARELRLILKKARTTVENNRKELKADIVKQGKAIDSVARYVKEEIEPAEEYLELQEKFAELAQAKREADLKAKRIEQLMQYTDDLSVYNLDGMTEDQFNTLLATLKAQYEAEQKRIADEAKAKAEAEEAERKRIEEQAKENARLKAEAEAREKAEAIEREKREKEEAERLEKERKEREAREAEQAKKDEAERLERERIQKEADEKIAKERAEREKLEQEKRDREAEEARKKAEAEEAERQALLAPDKDKLVQFAQAVETIRTQKLPAVKSNDAQRVVNNIELKLSQLFNYIMDETKKL